MATQQQIDRDMGSQNDQRHDLGIQEGETHALMREM
jgi:hypothetical protein